MSDHDSTKPPEDEDFASMLAEFERQPQGEARRRLPRVGETVRAPIVSIGAEAAFVDLGAKSDGMLDLVELRDADGRVTVAVGDIIEARVVEVGGKAGCIVLRRTMGRGPEANAELEQAFQHGIPVEGVVASVNKGGVEVQIAGNRAFCPISQLDVHRVEDATSYIGQKLTFRITKLEESGPRGRNLNLVVSRRALLEEEQKRRAAETRATLAVGAVVTGTVTTIKDYGAFVDLGGLEGMLHVSELGFARVAHPSEALTVGQQVTVQILKIEKGDDPRRGERISLSLKSLAQDPWDSAELLREGARVKGTVQRVEQYGAFVELMPGVEGLVHVSELGAGRNVRHPRDVLKPGQVVEVTVKGVDRERRRVSLSLEAPAEDEGTAAELAAQRSPGFGTFADLLKPPRKQ
jgi:small subunit ribosomal protein S1